MINPNIKLIVILGPTASGKTGLALDLAHKYNGEIVCADSRTIYRGMDIGTAKPTKAELALVTHHLLDVVAPNETLSVAAFKQLAEVAINDIAARGKIPFLVGGSGLYIDCILYDYQFPAEADEVYRAELNEMPDEALLGLLREVNMEAYGRIDTANRRRVIRAIETAGTVTSKRDTIRPNTLVLGLSMNKESSQKRIEERTEKMLRKGLIKEIETVGTKYGWDSEAMSGNAYRAYKDVVLGAKSIKDGTADNVRADMRLVKKQLTWFKRNRSIDWLINPQAADTKIEAFLESPVL